MAGMALSAGPMKRYLLGYVAGIVYYDGSEWLLTKSGQWCSNWPRTKESESHVWATEAQAVIVANKHRASQGKGKSFPVFTRPYCYETNNPENAKGLPPMPEKWDRKFVE